MPLLARAAALATIALTMCADDVTSLRVTGLTMPTSAALDVAGHLWISEKVRTNLSLRPWGGWGRGRVAAREVCPQPRENIAPEFQFRARSHDDRN
jgi:hypothetical protein